jgi:t-SNARE complex subunit (syntaxin)
MSDPSHESDAAARARRGRNIAIAVGLVLFVILIFFVTIVRLGANVLDRPL